MASDRPPEPGGHWTRRISPLVFRHAESASATSNPVVNPAHIHAANSITIRGADKGGRHCARARLRAEGGVGWVEVCVFVRAVQSDPPSLPAFSPRLASTSEVPVRAELSIAGSQMVSAEQRDDGTSCPPSTLSRNPNPPTPPHGSTPPTFSFSASLFEFK